MAEPMPNLLLSASTNNTVLGLLIMGKREQGENAASGMWSNGATWLLGTIIPPFQRPVVWDEERMTKFIESAWLGMHLGTFVVNNTVKVPYEDEDGNTRYHPTDLWLIDGQQRLTAIDRYLDDRFPVFGAYWSEVTVIERRRFASTSFASSEVQLTSEPQLRDLYDRMNFGGIVHTEDQRALPKL